MNDFDRYDFALSITGGLIMVGILLLGGPLWALVPVGMITCTISLYRHFGFPPRAP